MIRRFTTLFALAMILGCGSNPEGPTSPSAAPGDAVPGSESETAAPKENRVKAESSPASEHIRELSTRNSGELISADEY